MNDVYTIRDELRSMIQSAMADEGSAVDSESGNGEGDLWFTVDGIEYYLTVRKSNAQIAREAA